MALICVNVEIYLANEGWYLNFVDLKDNEGNHTIVSPQLPDNWAKISNLVQCLNPTRLSQTVSRVSINKNLDREEIKRLEKKFRRPQIDLDSVKEKLPEPYNSEDFIKVLKEDFQLRERERLINGLYLLKLPVRV
jgi:hypothetical protein